LVGGGGRWKEISAEDKSKFEAMAAEDKERAQTEKEAYKAKQAEEADATEDAGEEADEEEGDGDGDGEDAGKPAKKAKKAEPVDGKKEKKKKDPNAPKGALSAFMYYSADQRPSVKAEQPDLKMGEIAKIIGARCVV
jgi:structure-specific recognition protein 1